MKISVYDMFIVLFVTFSTFIPATVLVATGDVALFKTMLTIFPLMSVGLGSLFAEIVGTELNRPLGA